MYLGGADDRLEVVSAAPVRQGRTRNRTLLRFPSNDEGFSYRRVAFASHSGWRQHTNYRRRNMTMDLRETTIAASRPDDRVGRRVPAALRGSGTGSRVRGAVYGLPGYPRLVVTPARFFRRAARRGVCVRKPARVPGASTVATSTWNRMTGIYSRRRARRAAVQN